MTRNAIQWCLCVIGGLVLGVAPVLVSAQAPPPTFNSGSDGSLGAFAPVANTNVMLPPDGILHYTTVNIPAGVTVTFTKNATNTPVTMLATGDVAIAGSMNLSGENGVVGGQFVGFRASTAPGPGGFAGGQGGSSGLTNNAASDGSGPGGGRAGQAYGGAPGFVNSANGGTYGAPVSFVSLLPLFGGSGGGGTDGGNTATQFGNDPSYAGVSAGAGGGAMVVASTTRITISGSILANGGAGIELNGFTCPSGSGSGGAIRLVAPVVSVTGTLQATSPVKNCTAPGSPGRIRIESVSPGTIVSTNPLASISSVLGPVTVTSIPALINLPTVAFTSIGGIAPPANLSGSYTTPDVVLPGTTTNPVPVTITATNTPVPTTFTINIIPQFAATTSTTVNTTGSFPISTASTSVTLANGRVSALQVFAGFTLTASLAPIIDGEPADQVLLAAGYGEPSTLTLVTKSGKEIPVSQLSQADQLKVAMAFEAMRNKNR